MEKSSDAFRTISEVADILAIPQHVLRFWETKFSHIKPMKRAGNRRFYRPNDIDLIIGIKRLLYHEGYTIKGVQKLLKENGVPFIIAVGQGDAKAAEEIAQKKQHHLKNDLFADQVEIGQKQKKIFNLFKEDELIGKRKNKTEKDTNTLLQEALFELIECKRLLDRSRSH